MSNPIRVLVVDDHLVVRKGIRALLATEPDIEVVGEASNGGEAIREVNQLQPDIVIMDLVMPGMDGITAIQQILSVHPETRILVLTSFDADDKVFPAIRAGAMGYTLKNAGPDELVRAIHEVHAGESSLHPSIARKVLHELAQPPERPPASEPLTEREVEVLRLVAQGLTDKQVAEQLIVSPRTVQSHLYAIYSKLGVSSRTAATRLALEHHFV